jgi:hypothetical protein
LGAFDPHSVVYLRHVNCSSKGGVQMATQTNLEQPTLVLRRVLDALTDAEPLPSRRPRVRSVGPRAEVHIIPDPQHAERD